MRSIQDKNKQELEEYIQNAEMQKSNLEKNLTLAKDRLKKIEAGSICLDPLYAFEKFGGSLAEFEGACGNGLTYVKVRFLDFVKVLYLLNLGKTYYQARINSSNNKEFQTLTDQINVLVAEMLEKGIKP